MDNDQLYGRALDIVDRKARGLWLPIMTHLALRKYPAAMVALANFYDETGVPTSNTNPFSSDNLLRRAWQMGEITAAQSRAMGCFNSNDMVGFRRWARRAAMLGNNECRRYVKNFETRLPHGDARKIGRHRPYARRDT
jgi:hypothetical protein